MKKVKEIDICEDIIKEFFGEIVDDSGSTVDYTLYPHVSVNLLVHKLYEADKQLSKIRNRIAKDKVHDNRNS